MNPAEPKNPTLAEIDASCRVPLLALFGGAALWLIVGLTLALIAGIKFHAPEFLAGCPLLTYGRVAPAANDALLYGFAIPAALGVILWVFARLSRAELLLPLVPVVAANLWNVGILAGIVAILLGDSSGFTWLEFPRAASVLLLVSFVLIAVSAVATFGQRQDRTLDPSHWFLLAALLWFPWILSTASLFVVTTWPVRGVAQAVVGWWYADNLVFVWLALAGVGLAFYFLPRLGQKPLHGTGYALFAFYTLIGFGSWCGIPIGAPVPAWLPTLSTVAAILTAVPVVAIAIVALKTVCGSKVRCQGGPYCFIRFGSLSFVVSGLLYLAQSCPRFSQVVEFTWFGPAQVQLELLGFIAMILFGAIYEILPRTTGLAIPFPAFVRAHFWLSVFGVLLFVGPLAIGGVEQGIKLNDASLAFGVATGTALKYLRFSSAGQLLLLLGALLFAANIFVMTFKWKIALLKSALAAIKAPLAAPGVKS